MRPGTYNLELYRGDTYTWQFRVWKDAARTIPADLAGVEAKAEIRPGSGRTPIADLGCTVTVPNIIDVHLAAAVWSLIPYDLGRWDLQLTYPDAAVVTPVAGAVHVTPDITDSIAPAPAVHAPVYVGGVR